MLIFIQTANYSSLRSQTQARLSKYPGLLDEGTDVTDLVWLYNASKPRNALGVSGAEVKATNWYFEKWRAQGKRSGCGLKMRVQAHIRVPVCLSEYVRMSVLARAHVQLNHISVLITLQRTNTCVVCLISSTVCNQRFSDMNGLSTLLIQWL